MSTASTELEHKLASCLGRIGRLIDDAPGVAEAPPDKLEPLVKLADELETQLDVLVDGIDVGRGKKNADRGSFPVADRGRLTNNVLGLAFGLHGTVRALSDEVHNCTGFDDDHIPELMIAVQRLSEQLVEAAEKANDPPAIPDKALHPEDRPAIEDFRRRLEAINRDGNTATLRLFEQAGEYVILDGDRDVVAHVYPGPDALDKLRGEVEEWERWNRETKAES